jgi:hypothetical protein
MAVSSNKKRMWPLVAALIALVGMAVAALSTSASAAAQQYGQQHYVPTPLTRMMDTRNGAPDCNVIPKVVKGQVKEVDFTPKVAINATAVVINITAACPGSTEGFIAAYPCGASAEGLQSVNFSYNGADANRSVGETSVQQEVALGTGKRVCFASTAPVHVVVDLSGYMTPQASPGQISNSYEAVAPQRLFDSRNVQGRVGAGEKRVVHVTSAPNGQNAVLKITVSGALSPGFATLYQCSNDGLNPAPVTSSINYKPGVDTSNQAIIKVNDAGDACFSSYASAHIIIDLVGFWQINGIGLGVVINPVKVFESAGATSNEYVIAVPNFGLDDDIIAVSGVLTVVSPISTTWGVVYSGSGALPTVSDINFWAGGTKSAAFTTNVFHTGDNRALGNTFKVYINGISAEVKVQLTGIVTRKR